LSDDSETRRRLCRQEVLPEIGSAGQARLGAYVLPIPPEVGEFVRELAASYAIRAGLSGVMPQEPAEPSGTLDVGPWQMAFRYEAPKSVGLAASLVLGAMRDALELDLANEAQRRST